MVFITIVRWVINQLITLGASEPSSSKLAIIVLETKHSQHKHSQHIRHKSAAQFFLQKGRLKASVYVYNMYMYTLYYMISHVWKPKCLTWHLFFISWPNTFTLRSQLDHHPRAEHKWSLNSCFCSGSLIWANCIKYSLHHLKEHDWIQIGSFKSASYIPKNGSNMADCMSHHFSLSIHFLGSFPARLLALRLCREAGRKHSAAGSLWHVPPAARQLHPGSAFQRR